MSEDLFVSGRRARDAIAFGGTWYPQARRGFWRCATPSGEHTFIGPLDQAPFLFLAEERLRCPKNRFTSLSAGADPPPPTTRASSPPGWGKAAWLPASPPSTK